MQIRISAIALPLPLVFVVAACMGPPAPGGQQGAQAVTGQTTTPQRTLVVAVRGEPPSIADLPIASFSGLLDRPKALFNAELDFKDEREIPHPYLAEALPQLNTDTWTVSPDGRMQTTYHLKPNLTWHDGTPLTSSDFMFAHQLYSNPDFGQSGTPPISEVESVTAPDSQTIVIHWKGLYADAAVLEDRFPPLPKHILEEPSRTLDVEALAALPYWSTEYVGLGPYRVSNWPSGTFIEGQSFDGYVFGKPKIDQIKVEFIPDAQTALANVQAGTVHYVSDYVLTVSDGQVLEQQWAQDKGGEVLYSPSTIRYTSFQLRPEYVETPALLDVRVRRAVAHAIDAKTAVEVLTGGKGVSTDTLTPPRVDYYAQIEGAIQKHPYDPNQAQQLMEEAGYKKGSDGFFVGADNQHLQFSVSSTSGVRNETVAATYADNLKRSGFDVSQSVVSLAQLRLPESSAVVPGLQIRGGNNSYRNYTGGAIPRPENHWQGANYCGWNSPDYDQAFQGWLTTLAQSDRIKQIAVMERVISDQVPIIPHFFDPQVDPRVAALQGPVARQTPNSGGPFLYAYKWEWRS
ncbi:MAG: hypothetical protein GEU73_11735 [Chloroflexi bacterium]|nr:hypothetical protein [Chloroflexota bacterium]